MELHRYLEWCQVESNLHVQPQGNGFAFCDVSLMEYPVAI